jgi:hypothetical protein
VRTSENLQRKDRSQDGLSQAAWHATRILQLIVQLEGEMKAPYQSPLQELAIPADGASAAVLYQEQRFISSTKTAIKQWI